MITIEREHEIHCGHRVAGHEGKCAHLHGHGYVIHFTCGAEALDHLGRVIDFSVIKERLCMWLENVWDHKFLAWENDTVMQSLARLCAAEPCTTETCEAQAVLDASIVWTPFNPTAENMAEYLVNTVGPRVLNGTGVMLLKCRVEETRKCSATFTKEF